MIESWLRRITLSATLKMDGKGVDRRAEAQRRLMKYTKIRLMIAYTSVMQ